MNQNPVDGLPHDIHGLIPYQPSLLDYWPWLLVTVLLAGVILLAWSWWKRRRKQPKPVAPIDPWELLEQRIQSLVPADPFVGKEREQFFYDLSLALREAIERRIGLRATDMTLYELRLPLRDKLPFSQEVIDAVLAFLQRADFIKFAEAPVSREQALADADDVRRWAMELRRQPESVTASLTETVVTPPPSSAASPLTQARTPPDQPLPSDHLAWPSERAGLGSAYSGPRPATESAHSSAPSKLPPNSSDSGSGSI